MLNMASPTVQNIIQSQGYNPFNNAQYVPQQQTSFYGNQQPMMNYGYYQQPMYNNNYNPYTMYSTEYHQNEYRSYDSMPTCIVNEARNIHSQINQTPMYNNQYYGYNNPYNGYINPVLENNRREYERIEQRKLAIEQGKIWRSLFGNVEGIDVDVDELVKDVENMYYHEPVQEEIPIKKRIAMEKNRHIAEMEAKLDYYRQNNIPIVTPLMIERNNFFSYYNHINSIIGDPNDCDMHKYFTEVFPRIKQEQLAAEADHYNKNLKMRYNNKDYDSLVNKAADKRSDSYYYKMMESFAENGVKFTNGDGLTITPDQMEVKLPERFMNKHRKNMQDMYYEQRKKFYESVFRKDE